MIMKSSQCRSFICCSLLILLFNVVGRSAKGFQIESMSVYFHFGLAF